MIQAIQFNKKSGFITLFLIHYYFTFAQVVGTPYMVPIATQPPLDLVSDTPSFAFSTRKLKATYTGFALRLNRLTDNSQVDVAFDANGSVSSSSLVTLAVAGSSGATIGTTATLAAYKGTTPLYVSIWYDQSGNGRNAAQSNASNQPELLLASQNNQATIKFNGSHKLNVTATPNQILGTTSGGVQGIVGTLTFTSKLYNQGGNTPYSIGFTDNSQRRFMLHLNWSDSNCYFDGGEACCAGTRAFANSTSVNFWKQYTMQRQDVVKLARRSSVQMFSANGGTAVTAVGINYFGIGTAYDTAATRTGMFGEIGDFILYNIALTSTQLTILENNQMAFWNSY